MKPPAKPALAALLLLAAPALAQDEPSGLDLIGQGAGQILQGLRDEAQPAIEGLSGLGAGVLPTVTALVTEIGPGFFDVFGQVDSLSNYAPPAIQPNGDILIPRKPGAPAWTPPEAP